MKNSWKRRRQQWLGSNSLNQPLQGCSWRFLNLEFPQPKINWRSELSIEDLMQLLRISLTEWIPTIVNPPQLGSNFKQITWVYLKTFIFQWWKDSCPGDVWPIQNIQRIVRRWGWWDASQKCDGEWILLGHIVLVQ